MSEHGTIHWTELNTWDVDKAKAFYAATFGWSFEAMAMAQGTYWIIRQGDRLIGGLMPMTSPAFDGIPDHWFTYFAVDDLESRLRQAVTAGGKILHQPFDVPGVGRIAVVKDAVGAGAGWIQPV